MISRLHVALLLLVAGCVGRHMAVLDGDELAGSGEEAGVELQDLIDQALASPKKVKGIAQTIIRRHEAGLAQSELMARLTSDRDDLLTSELRAAVELYLLLPEANLPSLFNVLVDARRMSVRRTGWQVAAMYPSTEMGEAVSHELSRRATRGGTTGMSPEAAVAVRTNELKEAYPLLRTALMAEGHVAYAKAMISLNPEAAADDLLVYLGAIPSEMLTNGKLSKAQRTTCAAALEHFSTHTPSLHNPSFRQLFFFASAADDRLSDAASKLLVSFVKDRPEHFSFLLAQMPAATQKSFLDRLEEDDPTLHARVGEMVRTAKAEGGV